MGTATICFRSLARGGTTLNKFLSSSPPLQGEFRIGVGSGFAGDRFEPAIELARYGHLDSLVFECLAERTIAAAHERKIGNTGPGYDLHIIKRILQVAPYLLPPRKTIITNAGAADPFGAARDMKIALENAGLKGFQISAVTGDDVLNDLKFSDVEIIGTSDSLDKYGDRVISANAYLGAEPIVEALNGGANIVFTGRNSDASLFLAPAQHHFKWDSLDLIAAGTLVGHLLECAGQLSGGYFSDGFHKVVPNLAQLGFPYADLREDGSSIFTKLIGTGGLLTRETVLEQLLYEIDDPSAYLTPDVILDLRKVQIKDLGEDRVQVTGGRGSKKPEKLKVSIGIRDGYGATGQILYSGIDSLKRASMAGRILRERWEVVHHRDPSELTVSFIGANAATPWIDIADTTQSKEVALFAAIQADEKAIGELLCQEVEALYTNGPYGGGGVITTLKESISLISALVDRSLVHTKVVNV